MLSYLYIFVSFQWKVRRTLAFSIHEMALILGDEITSLDLVPIFNGFLKDLDEVRIGVLKHFADFVKVRKLDAFDEVITIDPQTLWKTVFQIISICSIILEFKFLILF